MNDKNNSETKFQKKRTATRFKLKNPFRIFQNISASFKKKNVNKQPSFWLPIIFFLLLTFKVIQLTMF